MYVCDFNKSQLIQNINNVNRQYSMNAFGYPYCQKLL